MEKSKNLHQQLKDLKSEIEVLKVEEKQTHLDRLHEEKSEAGDNKFITLQKVNSPFFEKKHWNYRYTEYLRKFIAFKCYN